MTRLGYRAVLLRAVRVGALAIASVASAQVPLTPGEAQRKAEGLLGKSPDRVECYFSGEEKVNYLAFSSRRESGGSEIWLYKESGESHELRQRWHEVFDVFSVAPDRFVVLPGEKFPHLRLKGVYGGSGAGNTQLAVYSVESGSLSWVVYHEDWSVGGLPRITVDYEHASDPHLRTYLESWAHAEGIDRPDVASDPEDIANVEQAWIDANGYMTSGVVQIRHFKNLKARGETLRLDDKRYVVANVPDGGYIWYSIFKGPVGGYDKVTGRYFIVYVQEDAYAWADRLKVIGPWLYVAPRDEHWKLRFNKATHELEQGDFDNIVQPPSAASPGGPREGSDQPSLAEQLPSNVHQVVKRHVEDFDVLLKTLSTRDYDKYLELFTDYARRLSIIQDQYPKTMWPKLAEGEKASWVSGLYDQVYCYFDKDSPQYYLSVRQSAVVMLPTPMWKLPWAAYFLVPGARLELIEFRQRGTRDATLFLKLQFGERNWAPWDQLRTNEVKDEDGRLRSWDAKWVRIRQMTIKVDVSGADIDEGRWRRNLRGRMFLPLSMGGDFALLDYEYYDSPERLGP